VGAYEGLYRRAWRAYMRQVERRVDRVEGLARPLVEPARDRPPVLLVPGYGNSERSMGAFRRSLERDGIEAEAITLPAFGYDDAFGDVDVVAMRARALAGRAGSEQVDIVGHSRGGLIARGAQQATDGLVRRVVTLSSANRGHPYRGLAQAWMPRGLRQISESTPFMRQLNDPQSRAGREVVAICTGGIDWIVAPASMAWLDDMPRIMIDEGRRIGPMSRLTHYTMLRDDRTYEAIREALLRPTSAG
jgi:pimeloyl-ACP methyl ester carboxylesterase